MCTVTIIKLINGKGKCEISNNRTLYVSRCNGAYDLTLHRSTASGRGTINTTLCEDKKRLTTINKYAAEFGVRFAEVT